MSYDKFDFHTAEALVVAVTQASSDLETQNDSIQTNFGKLHEYFQDAGYDDYESDMSKTTDAVEEMLQQMATVAQSIKDYADKLREVV